MPDKHYGAVSEWVNRMYLRGSLFYHHVRSPRSFPRQDAPGPLSLICKVDVKQDSLMSWVGQHLADKLDFACCQTPAELANQYQGVTAAGLIKFPGSGHLKDDHTRLDDRSRYVLGWSNHEKIQDLVRKRSAVEAQAADVGGRLSHAQAGARRAKERGKNLTALQEYRDFRELDWRASFAEQERLKADLVQLESASDALVALREQKQLAEAQLSRQRDTIGQIHEQIGNRKKECETMRGLDLELEPRAVPVQDELLQRLRQLQLLVITPLNRIDIIEPYVKNIGFVANPTGSCSVLRNISIEDHRQRKQTAVA